VPVGRKTRSTPVRGSRRPAGQPIPGAEPSDASTRRLSLYLRALNRCSAEGRRMASSEDLARAAAVKSALVRKDLTRFGQFGIRGVGYEVQSLREHLTRILGLDQDHRVIILGAGNLGMALAESQGFNTGGFKTLALFDNYSTKIDHETRSGLPILSMRRLAGFVKKNQVDVGVLAVPAETAQHVLDQASSAGVRAVLNFVPATLRSPQGLHVRNVDLKIHLEGLAYRLSRSVLPSAGGGRSSR